MAEIETENDDPQSVKVLDRKIFKKKKEDLESCGSIKKALVGAFSEYFNLHPNKHCLHVWSAPAAAVPFIIKFSLSPSVSVLCFPIFDCLVGAVIIEPWAAISVSTPDLLYGS